MDEETKVHIGPKIETKADHASAIKISGGVRVPRKSRLSDSEKQVERIDIIKEKEKSYQRKEFTDSVRVMHDKPVSQYPNPPRKPMANVFQPTNQN
ncbi:hypothetical protein AB6A40_001523 [Gnathostoma spinigerum]|uniref:Uncharacterized protein n=1 Tax=Gnathostoma spinigerum TaxID=75299 RepID=A0ABD6E9I8_9BILA